MNSNMNKGANDSLFSTWKEGSSGWNNNNNDADNGQSMLMNDLTDDVQHYGIKDQIIIKIQDGSKMMLK